MKTLSPEELQNLLLDVYTNIPTAKNYLEFWLDPNPEKALEECKQKITRIFFTSNDTPRKRPNFTKLKDLKKHFSVTVIDEEYNLRLLLYTAELYEHWIEKRRIFSQTALSRLEKEIDTIKLLHDSLACEEFDERINKLAAQSSVLRERKELTAPSGFRRRRRW